jgi:ABC-type transport system involved in cytochrome c biogenesis ATPase subunit
MSSIISVANLSKTYESGFKALKNVNLDIRRGEIFALLGPNGAGKTTLISIICGIANPSEGRVLVGGEDIVISYRKARSLIGLVPQELHTDAFESVWATVSFSRGLFGKPKNPAHIEKVLKDLSLWDKKDNKIITLSGGMKRRVMIAKALSHPLAEAVHAAIGHRQHLHGAQRPLDDVAIGDPVQVGDVPAELAGGEAAGHGFVLGHQRQPGVHRTIGAGVGAGDRHPSLVHRQQAGDGPHQRGLAGAVRAQETGHPGSERAAELRQSHLLTEPHRRVRYGDGGVGDEGGIERRGERRGRSRREDVGHLSTSS